jgi:hypothetical protein
MADILRALGTVIHAAHTIVQWFECQLQLSINHQRPAFVNLRRFVINGVHLRKKGEWRRQEGEGRREKEEGRREKGEGRRKKEEDKREKRREKRE